MDPESQLLVAFVAAGRAAQAIAQQTLNAVSTGADANFARQAADGLASLAIGHIRPRPASIIADTIAAYHRVLTSGDPGLVPQAAWLLGQFLDRLGELTSAAVVCEHIADDPNNRAQWANIIEPISDLACRSHDAAERRSASQEL